MLPTTNLYIVDLEGNLKFTREGRQEMAELFSMAGVEIERVKTYQDYLEARQAASPYFLAWLKLRADSWPDSPEIELIKNCLFGVAP